MAEICLSCAAIELLGISVAELVAMTLGHTLVAVCEQSIKHCIQNSPFELQG